MATDTNTFLRDSYSFTAEKGLFTKKMPKIYVSVLSYRARKEIFSQDVYSNRKGR